MNMLNTGLISLREDGEANSSPVALTGVKVDVEASGTSALVRVQQRYVNTEEHAIEASYLFPLEDESAVVGFKVYTRDLTLVGQMLEREEAFARYDDAMIEGHGAYLLDQERANAFTARVGKLKPQQEAVIELSYVSTLHFEGERVRLVIPTVVAPRYVPVQEEAPGEPERALWQATRQLEVPYGLEINVRLNVADCPALIESPSHPTRLSLSDGCVVVSLSREAEALDRDFVLTFDALPESQGGVATLERSLEADGAYVSATCRLPVSEEGRPRPVELIYVLDCSGSMMGEPIQQAKRALRLLLRGLEEGDRFNLVCFGSEYTQMWSEPKPFNQVSLDQALSYLKRVDANLGGTELLAPFKAICSQLAKGERQAEVVLLTDGQVSNEAQIISLCSAHKAHVRVFSFGIGSSASETLVRGLGRVTRGAAEFISEGERIEPKVLRAGKRLRQPSVLIDRVTLGKRSLKLAGGPRALFEGELTTIYASLREAPKRLPKTLKVTAGDHVMALPIYMSTSRGEMSGAIGALWAREEVRRLERQQVGFHMDKDARAKIVRLALAHSLMSSQTSFVAIERRDEAELELGEAPLRKVPLSMTSDHRRLGFDVSMRRHKGMRYLYSIKNDPFSSFFGGVAQSPESMMLSQALRFESATPPDDLMMAPPTPAPLSLAAPLAPSPSSGAPSPSAPRALKGGARGLGGSPKMAPASEPLSATDKLFELLELQLASGAFTWGEAVERLLGDAQGPSTLERRDDRLMTALVLSILKAQFSADRDLWELSADKAERFIARGGALSEQLKAKVSALTVWRSV